MIDPHKELASPSFASSRESSMASPSFDVPEISQDQQEAPEILPLPQVEKESSRELPESNPTVEISSGSDGAIDILRRTLRRSKKKKPTAVPQIRDEITTQVEKIMEDGLKDAFVEMTPVQQQEFKIKGEETALQIRTLLQSTKIKAKRVVRLLVDWLRLLPGVNKFFIEQEAKIKADKIIALHHHLPPRV